jgi:hypothetical protein
MEEALFFKEFDISTRELAYWIKEFKEFLWIIVGWFGRRDD